MRKSDVLDFEGVEMVAKNFPNTRATAFLDRLTTRITTKNKVNLNTHISAFSCIFLPCKSLDLRGVFFENTIVIWKYQKIVVTLQVE